MTGFKFLNWIVSIQKSIKKLYFQKKISLAITVLLLLTKAYFVHDENA